MRIVTFVISAYLLASNITQAKPLVPDGWVSTTAADSVMQGLIRVTGPEAKGAHDAEFVCVGDRAFVVEHDNDSEPGHNAGAAQYCVLTVVNLRSMTIEKRVPMAKSRQKLENAELPSGMCFVPRIIRIAENTLRTYFCSQPKDQEAATWYRDFDLNALEFAPTIHRAKLQTSAGLFPMEPQYFHADAAAHGFKKTAVKSGLYIIDSFKQFDGRWYVAINNFVGKQNALAVLSDDFTTFEIVGHYNEPQTEQLSESSVNRLPDGTWMAICRDDKANYNYRFTTSRDGVRWSPAVEEPFVPNGLNSKPTFDKFGDVYYLGWQENTRIAGAGRSVFNIDVSRDGKHWERKYRFETAQSFQYPTLHEHDGAIWLSVTQSDHKGSTDRIMFGRLESRDE